MPRAKKPPLSFVEKVKKLQAARLSQDNVSEANSSGDIEELESIELRIKRILGITERVNKDKSRMLFFVMYDIESNKVRRLVHKYLIDNGCSLIQRSVFLADAPIETFNKIKADLEAVQASYDNNDSILVLPVSTDYLKMMKIIGQQIAVDVITHNRNTLFF